MAVDTKLERFQYVAQYLDSFECQTADEKFQTACHETS